MKFLLVPATIAASLLSVVATAALAQDFPLTIEHKFGATVIESQPERVASLDFSGADNLIALGVDPITVRYFSGNYPRAVWPWADALLGDDPEILRGDLNFEQIAATNPDVIIAIQSGITEEDYETLSLIAPVVAVPEGMGDYELSWEERALLAGRAIGREAQAQEQVDAIRNTLAEIAESHPDWSGKTAIVAFTQSGDRTQPGGHTSYDVRAQFLGDMGFVTPAAIDEMTAGEYAFYVNLSSEEIDHLEAYLLVWRHDNDNWASVQNLFGRDRLKATQEGRDVFMGPELTGALNHASLLSLPFAIEQLVPMIEAVLDGDPTTHTDGRPAELAFSDTQ
jgi:iron complex transport system substrate-binding protein